MMPPSRRDLVLIGGGHSHALVLRQLGDRPIPGVRLTLVSGTTHTPYSGMLPGYIAGHYRFDDVHIDLVALARFAGARFVGGEAVAIDRAARTVRVSGHGDIGYDRLSINVGSTPQVDVSGAADRVVPLKPIHRLNDRWLALIGRISEQGGSLRIAVVGAGAGGVEMALSMQYRLRDVLRQAGQDPDRLRVDLFAAGPAVLPSHARSVRRRIESILSARGIDIHHGAPVAEVRPDGLVTGDGRRFDADEIIWATRAGGAAWLKATGLALDPDGFIRVGETLQTVADPDIFAAGDIASMVGYRLEKSGVVAVRQGPPLAENLRRSLAGRPLIRYRPQSRWLALIGTGDRYAIASYGRLGIGGRWVWHWKDRIDRRFMNRFAALPPASPATAPSA